MKVIKDCIYGHIAIPELCLLFIDTPEFQRLRRIKQLGVAQHIYPSAVHTRFEHSLGVMHLAGKMVHILDPSTPVRIIELIQLSACLHDQGHQALSHLFDQVIHETKATPPYALHHEQRSVDILKLVNRRIHALSLEEEAMVIDMILGNAYGKPQPWMYEIVSNKRCGLDVDRMDYLRRDAYHTHFPGFQSDYILLNAIVGRDGHVAFREKARSDIEDLYRTRVRAHRVIYQHHTCRKIDRIYFCAMKRLQDDIFSRDFIDDYELETLLRQDPKTREVMRELDERNLSHICAECESFGVHVSIPPSASDAVCFVE